MSTQTAFLLGLWVALTLGAFAWHEQRLEQLEGAMSVLVSAVSK